LLREGLVIASRIYRAFGKLGERGPEDGPPLMVLPGFLATDRTTLGLQRALADVGYRVTGWGLGFNRGARRDTLERIASRIEEFGRGRKVILVGWSLGGIFAREVAKARPDLVEKVITLGAPFSGSPRANNAWRVYELVSRHRVDEPPLQIDAGSKPPVPTLAIWSRCDGVVAPASARGQLGERDEALELDCSHMAYVVKKAAYPKIVAAIRNF
jgi:pimeloyl-ACP methyl ester carboxylesterase